MATGRAPCQDLHEQLVSGTSATIVPTSTPSAAGAQLIGFHCLVCGYLTAQDRQPASAPTCAGYKGEDRQAIRPTQMTPYLLE